MYRRAIEQSDGTSEHGGMAYEVDVNDHGIDKVEIHVDSSGQAKTFFPVNGRSVRRWNPNYGNNGR